MKVYVVVERYDYEGCSEPAAIFDNPTMASDLQYKLLSRRYHADDVLVMEYDLNVVPDYIEQKTKS